MNERIKELAEQAGLIVDGEHWFSAIQETDVRSIDLERFAELVAAHEREACAKLCDGWTQADGDACAEAIRARSKHD